jgi:hypothetical protein
MAFVTTARAQTTIMSSTSVPKLVDSNDGGAVELGVKFNADAAGYITGLRFYKATKNTGSHVGHLWSSTGTLLGTATFTNETASGWQQVNFSTPIAVSAKTTYVASYFAPVGHYSADLNYFATKGVDNPPLHAIADGANGPNGVYRYSSTGGFPTNGYFSTNYWVDVVYTTSAQSGVNPQLSVSPTVLSFGNVAVSSSATKTVTLTSTGGSALTVNSVSITGTGFTLIAGIFPTTLNPGQSLTLQLQFKPTADGSASGQLTINTNSASGGTAVVTLSGAGTTGNPQLSMSPTTLSFGSVAVDSGVTKTVTLTSTGASALTVNSASITGAGFSIIGGTFPTTLNPGQSLTLQLQFEPTAAGSVTGQFTVSTNSTTGGTSVVTLSGSGMSSIRAVDLTWNAPSTSTDPVAGYYVYRSTGSGSLQLMNSSMTTQTTYVDSAVASGTTYNYVVKSVDSNGIESAPSNQISVSTP